MRSIVLLSVVFVYFDTLATLGEIGVFVQGAKQIKQVLVPVIDTAKEFRAEVKITQNLPSMTVAADANGKIAAADMANYGFRLQSCSGFQIMHSPFGTKTTLDFRYSWGWDSVKKALHMTMNGFDLNIGKRSWGKTYRTFIHITKPVKEAVSGHIYMAVTVEFVQEGKFISGMKKRSITGHFFSDGRPVKFEEFHGGKPDKTTVGNCINL